jgi:N-acetyl-anhydromuramyl-L-alanine amidase AmpD
MLTRNFTQANRTDDDIFLMILHSSEGTGSAKALGDYFQTTDRQVSYHYGIDANGVVEKYVDPSDISWGAANWDVNKRCINIGLVGYGAKNAFTIAQQETLVSLMAELSHRYDLSLRRVYDYFAGRVMLPFGVAQHRNVPGADHTDIGPDFPIRLLCTHARARRNERYGIPKFEAR